jgi:hypothetical protein
MLHCKRTSLGLRDGLPVGSMLWMSRSTRCLVGCGRCGWTWRCSRRRWRAGAVSRRRVTSPSRPSATDRCWCVGSGRSRGRGHGSGRRSIRTRAAHPDSRAASRPRDAAAARRDPPATHRQEYVTDERYPWPAICEREFGRRPVQVIDERNSIVHLSDYEGAPGRRPMTREELTLFFDHCDARVQARRALGRKGSLAAFRDATLFKVIYAWGLRRQEAARLDVSDFGRNPHRSSFGRRDAERALRQGVARRSSQAAQRADGV